MSLIDAIEGDVITRRGDVHRWWDVVRKSTMFVKVEDDQPSEEHMSATGHHAFRAKSYAFSQ